MATHDDSAFWHGVNRSASIMLAVLVALAGLIGAAGPGGLIGLGVFGAALAVLAIGIKRHYDGAAPLSLTDLVIEDFATLAIGLPLLAVLSIAGLALAAGAERSDVAALGYGLFVGAVLLAFLSVKACYDAAARS